MEHLKIPDVQFRLDCRSYRTAEEQTTGQIHASNEEILQARARNDP